MRYGRGKTDDEIRESVIGFEALYDSMMKCKKGVLWKNQPAHYYLNGIEETLKLNEQLKDGTYKPRKPRKVHTQSHVKQ
jgi:RNA-directed DNA polymerase